MQCYVLYIIEIYCFACKVCALHSNWIEKVTSCLSTILICLLGLSDWIGLGEALYGIILGFHKNESKAVCFAFI